MSLSMAFEFREKALESHEAILTYMRELKIPFKKETDNPPVTPSSSPITLTSPPALTVKPEYGNLIINQDLEHVLENKLPTEDGIEILNSMSNHDTQNQNTIELQLDELIIPVKGEELPQENDEYTKANIANSSPEHTYEEIQEVDDEDEEDICGEDTNNEQQQYDDGMDKLSLIEEGEDDEDGVQHHNLEDHDDEHIIGVEAHNERMSLIETTSGTKAWNQQVNENKIQIDLQYDGSALESKPASRRSRSTKDAMDFLGYVCDICGNVFSKRSRMMEHRQRHERELKYTCE